MYMPIAGAPVDGSKARFIYDKACFLSMVGSFRKSFLCQFLQHLGGDVLVSELRSFPHPCEFLTGRAGRIRPLKVNLIDWQTFRGPRADGYALCSLKLDAHVERLMNLVASWCGRTRTKAALPAVPKRRGKAEIERSEK